MFLGLGKRFRFSICASIILLSGRTTGQLNIFIRRLRWNARSRARFCFSSSPLSFSADSRNASEPNTKRYRFFRTRPLTERGCACSKAASSSPLQQAWLSLRKASLFSRTASYSGKSRASTRLGFCFSIRTRRAKSSSGLTRTSLSRFGNPELRYRGA